MSTLIIPPNPELILPESLTPEGGGIDRIRSTLSRSKDTYVTVRAADLVELFTAAGMKDEYLCRHAVDCVKAGARSTLGVHREIHLGPAMRVIDGSN